MEGSALFRAKINAFAAVPLTILLTPNKPERKFGHGAFSMVPQRPSVNVEAFGHFHQRPKLQL
jgi:hypothetical protein